MKKIVLGLTIIALSLVLAGCSLAPTSSTNPAAPVANPDNSIWASFDSGKTWQNNFLPNSAKTDIAAADVLSIAVNPFDAKNVFVGLRGAGILKTDNGGQDWSYMNFQSEKVYGLGISPLDGKVIYATGVWQKRGKIFKSVDAGATWTEIYTAASAGPLAISLTIDKKNPKVIYATTSDNQILKTVDEGVSWKNTLEASSPVLKIAIDSSNSQLLYAVTQNGEILRSKDAGVNFEDLTKQMSDAQMNETSILETDPLNGNWVYVAGQSGLFRSKDAGNTWEKIKILSNPETFPVKALAISPKNSKEIIYGAAQAAYRSIDGGASWETFQFNIAKSVNAIKYAGADPTNLYLGFSK